MSITACGSTMEWKAERVSELLAVKGWDWNPPLFMETVDSTNSHLRRLHARGYGEGCVVCAESQSSGRGRFGRSWFSPPGAGIWVSMLLEPAAGMNSGIYSVQAGALSALESIENATGRTGELKWPNDILFSGRKIAGILAESILAEGSIAMIVLGIGINANQDRDDFPSGLREKATSCKIEAGRSVEREPILAETLIRIREYHRLIKEGNGERVSNAWKERCATIGRRVTVSTGSKPVTGIARGVDERGALSLVTDDGEIVIIPAGDAEYEEMCGMNDVRGAGPC